MNEIWESSASAHGLWTLALRWKAHMRLVYVHNFPAVIIWILSKYSYQYLLRFSFFSTHTFITIKNWIKWGGQEITFKKKKKKSEYSE